VGWFLPDEVRTVDISIAIQRFPVKREQEVGLRRVSSTFCDNGAFNLALGYRKAGRANAQPVRSWC
jgi:hypothetical protein